MERQREDIRERIDRRVSEEGVGGFSTTSDVGSEIENTVSDVTITELEKLRKKKQKMERLGGGVHNLLS